MTASGLGRRLDSLEEANLHRTCRRLAAEYETDFDELLADCKRVAAEHRRLQALGLPPRELNRRLVAWIADDAGVDADELEAELMAELERLRRGVKRR